VTSAAIRWPCVSVFLATAPGGRENSSHFMRRDLLLAFWISIAPIGCGGGSAGTAAVEPAPASAPAATPTPTQPQSPQNETAQSAPEAQHGEARPDVASAAATLTGDRIEISGAILFERSGATISAESDPVLGDVIAVLRAHPEIRVLRIVGHTDPEGTEARNRTLSAHRAAAVARYLREHGVTIELRSEGLGTTQQLCSEPTDECRARNRRVEFIVARRQWTGP